jgi:hypothetical protein
MMMKKTPPATPTSRTPRASTRPILGFPDRIEDAEIAGWSFDPIDPAAPLAMRVIIDGSIADVLSCDVNRPDVSALNLSSTKFGFEYSIPAKFQDGLRHVLSLAGLVDGLIQGWVLRVDQRTNEKSGGG